MSSTNVPAVLPARGPAADRHRPQYHFTAPAGWLNDPNGLIQWGDEYHLFYQHNPHGPFHGTIHWGHAVSEDLIHWRDLPVALAPTLDGTDALGCWSGCAVDDHGVPTLVYTGVSPQVVNLATSADGLLTWEKYAGNPVIAGPPPELTEPSGGDFRDPFVWRADGHWYLMMGSRAEGAGGLVLLYRSEDLLHWEYLNRLLCGDAAAAVPGATEPFSTGVVWECPNLLDFGEKQALLVSAQRAGGFLYPFYVAGAFSPTGFVTETQDVLVYGGPQGSFYAPQVMRRHDGSYVLWGWLPEGRSARAVMAGGWAGALSIPLTVSMPADGRLQLCPAAELQALRREHWHFEDLDLAAGAGADAGADAGTGACTGELLLGVLGDSLEIVVRLALGPQSEAGLCLRCSPDGAEQTRIIVQPAQRQILIEREHASLDLEVDREPCRAPFDPAAGRPITLHIFLDHSVLEVFVDDGHDGQTNLASRIYPVRPDSLGIGLFSGGSSARVLSLDVWRLASIW